MLYQYKVSKRTLATHSLPAPASQAIQSLARDIAVARKRRRIPQRLLAQRMMVSLDTVHRLEHADPGVSLGVVASALWVLGSIDRLSRLLAPETDVIGQAEDARRLPQRIRHRRAASLDF
jgi:hypothetical protein